MLKKLKSMPESELSQLTQQTMARSIAHNLMPSCLSRAASETLLGRQNSMGDRDSALAGLQVRLIWQILIRSVSTARHVLHVVLQARI